MKNLLDSNTYPFFPLDESTQVQLKEIEAALQSSKFYLLHFYLFCILSQMPETPERTQRKALLALFLKGRPDSDPIQKLRTLGVLFSFFIFLEKPGIDSLSLQKRMILRLVLGERPAGAGATTSEAPVTTTDDEQQLKNFLRAFEGHLPEPMPWEMKEPNHYKKGLSDLFLRGRYGLREGITPELITPVINGLVVFF